MQFLKYRSTVYLSMYNISSIQIEILNISLQYNVWLVIAETQMINQKISPGTFPIGK